MRALLLVLLLVAVAAAAEKPKTYSTKYDNVDVDSILGNGRILTSYVKCMLDEGPCTPDARELKSEYKRRYGRLGPPVGQATVCKPQEDGSAA
jgi:hypothetical protein